MNRLRVQIERLVQKRIFILQNSLYKVNKNLKVIPGQEDDNNINVINE